MKVGEVMTRNVATVSTEATLASAADLMYRRDCGFVPVVDQTDGHLVGVLTDRDICIGGLTQGLPLHAIPVTCSMARTVYSCQESSDTTVVGSIMREHRVRRVPVLDDHNRVVGVVAIDDLAQKACHAKGNLATAMKSDVAETLNVVSRRPAPLQTKEGKASV